MRARIFLSLTTAQAMFNFFFFFFFYNNFICREHRKKGAAREELNPHIRQPPALSHGLVKYSGGAGAVVRSLPLDPKVPGSIHGSAESGIFGDLLSR